MGLTVAVTGGDGFIGKAVQKELRFRGHEPISIDRASGTDVVAADALMEALRPANAVIHLAGVLGTAELFEWADVAVQVNIQGTINVLRACEEHHLNYVGITMPQVWDNVYQVTKNAAMGLARAWNKHRGVPISHVRAFNVFGPGQKVGAPQKIIPTFSAAAYAGKPLPIWGDGLQTVDLVYVEDVARVLCDAVHFGQGEIFDAGTGEQYTVIEVAGYVARATKREVKLEYLPMREGENESTKVAAQGEGWDALGWHPEFREQDLLDTVRSYAP